MATVAEVFSKGKISRESILIFLTVGTWRRGYDRVVKAVDDLVSRGVISEEVIAQTGYGCYTPQHMTVIKFCSPERFRELIAESRCVISHAGMGTIIETVRQGKPLIAVPRKPELKEVDNDHQFVTARQLESEGKILVAYEVSDLPEKLAAAAGFVPTQGQGGNGILQAVKQLFEEVAARKGKNIHWGDKQ